MVGVCGQVGSLLEQRRPASNASSLVSVQAQQSLDRVSVSCAAYLCEGNDNLNFPIPPRARPSKLACLDGRGTDVKATFVFHGRRARRVTALAHGLLSELSDSVHQLGTGPSSPHLPNHAFYVRLQLLFRLTNPRSSPSGDGVRGMARAAVASLRNATWLILPVVICLSQRLSHACVSMN